MAPRMNEKVVHIDDKRPHGISSVRCVNCGQTWLAVYATSAGEPPSVFECPTCFTMNGRPFEDELKDE